jgi:radical SAM protein with 4Fe4S-binding SPASM domain
VATVVERVGELLGRRAARKRTELRVRAGGRLESADRALRLPSEGDGAVELVVKGGRTAATPDRTSQYLYFVIASGLRRSLAPRLVIEVEHFGTRYGTFRLQYCSTDAGAPFEGRYKEAEQLWDGEESAEPRWRRSLFVVGDFDPQREQNCGASFRLELRSDFYVGAVAVSAQLPEDLRGFQVKAPLPSLRKSPDRFYPIWWLFVELTNLCNFHCTFCPDEIMERPRGVMSFEEATRIFDMIAREKSWLGPLYPVKLHQMGEPTIHPQLVDIVAHAESKGIAIELNTNCSLLTPQLVEGLYRAGLTNLILSYQTPDEESFKTRKVKNKKLTFDLYLEKVKMAVERKVATGARTHIELDVMNTVGSPGIRIVGEETRASRILLDWIAFARALERKYDLQPRRHNLDYVEGGFRFLQHSEDEGRYEILPGVDLVWKRLHTWGNVIQAKPGPAKVDGYCPAPNEQFVILWDGRVTVCCTDYEGTLAVGSVKEQSIAEIWSSPRWKHMRQQMWQDVLESRTCRICKGAEPPGSPLVQISL